VVVEMAVTIKVQEVSEMHLLGVVVVALVVAPLLVLIAAPAEEVL
jgi:hypothetical protein